MDLGCGLSEAVAALLTGFECVHVGPGGKLLGKILVGEVANLVFAGDVLVMMKETQVLAVKLTARGVVLPGMLAPAVA